MGQSACCKGSEIKNESNTEINNLKYSKENKFTIETPKEVNGFSQQKDSLENKAFFKKKTTMNFSKENFIHIERNKVVYDCYEFLDKLGEGNKILY